MMNNDFAAFILSHGRPDNVVTYNYIKSFGYTGKIYIIIDDLDKTRDKYIENFGDKVIIFNKQEIADQTDQGDNFNDLRTTTHVRNAMFNIAKDLGIKYFVQLDDDYMDVTYTENRKGDYIRQNCKVKNLDKVFDSMLTFLKNTNCHSIAMAQGGDFIGGDSSSVFTKKMARKCMNSFVCSVDRPFKFIGRLNEDVNTYVRNGVIGKVFFTTSLVRLEQKATQSNTGGMTETYIDNGTYVKSFYTVMFQPSSVKIGLMGNKDMRLHHCINWKKTVPKIISEDHKKY